MTDQTTTDACCCHGLPGPQASRAYQVQLVFRASRYSNVPGPQGSAGLPANQGEGPQGTVQGVPGPVAHWEPMVNGTNGPLR